MQISRFLPKQQDQNSIFLILLYCVFFAAVRLLISHSLTHDEAEQIICSRSYQLGFSQQAPLYSWVLKTLSFVAPINLLTLTLSKYFFCFVFLFALYLIARIRFAVEQSRLVLISSLFFITYSYDFNRDLTHTILCTAISALAYLVYLRLLIRRTSFNYALFGFVCALGFLSKYNFVILILIFVCASLSNRLGRRVLLNFKTFISLAVFLFLISPNLLWFYHSNFSGFHYVLDRADTEHQFSLVKFIVSMLIGYYEVLLALVLFLLAIASLRLKDRFRSLSELGYIDRIIINTGFYALSLPILIAIIFRFNKFYSKWMAPFYFILILAFFVSLAKQKSNQRFWILALMIIAISSSITFIGACFPGYIGSMKNTQYPYDAISKQIASVVQELGPEKTEIIVDMNHLLYGNLLASLPHYLKGTEVNDRISNPSKSIKIFLWDNKNKKRFKKVREICPQAKRFKLFKAKFINGEQLKRQFVIASAVCEIIP